jgi:hypothetical protein
MDQHAQSQALIQRVLITTNGRQMQKVQLIFTLQTKSTIIARNCAPNPRPALSSLVFSLALAAKEW